MIKQVEAPSLPMYPDALESAERLVTLARLTQKRSDHVYAYIEGRGIVICDNYDYPFAVTLIVTPTGLFLAHLNSTGQAYEISEDDATHIAKGFFTYGSDYAMSLSFDLEPVY